MNMALALTISVWFAAIVWFLWLVWYTVRAKWWKTSIGSNTFLVSATLFLVLGRIAWARVDTDFKEAAWIGVAVYTIAGFAGIWRYWLFRKAQKENKK